jgi:sn-glycerol 3-phosphate transport system permease protein
LSPTTFYLVVLNVVFVLFSTFGVIDIVTQGGPNNATRTLVYQVYVDAFHNLDTGFGGAETVLLILIISVLSIFQFRVINRRVHYQ